MRVGTPSTRRSAVVRSIHRTSGDGMPNVTPMIDVMMCLIIFFLLVGRLVAEQRSEMLLPPAVSGTDEKIAENFFINITPTRNERTGERTDRVSITVENQPVDADRLALLRDRLSNVPDTVVHLRAERTLPFATISPIIDTCRDVGVGSVRLATEHIQ